ncbi:2-oxo-4-hydroxy-4-carboxy-5-ureidoimidazoline decarboxylase [Motiliproteus coralliicola]|uniref:2-oxo-4-hydroxy-4-carboxy-5-ureidoimidazoline decarboxylase n=1 Tax=Motiliproteus coralliicola TaxID=2283196 RepID=A0A369WMF7_9GAMM|nr:2-oxo-4-hydroxy-4-carboxy-5-ureidoimidazoline decarboxylase [Motiliproteus coralliicola]RDE22867.1 2-oxo-4-hydroxy-4-carboxy-5-ureidoimidazoline decarboxylase [Motiliproteus coralliicola]
MNAQAQSKTFQQFIPSMMGRADFISTFADIYEHSAWVAEQAWERGLSPVHDQVDGLHQLMADILLSSSRQAQLDLINAHPDLAGKAAIAGELTEASTSEQAGAGIHECSAEEFQRFTQLNDAYKSKFGFPFIKAVKGSNRFQILEAFEERIHNTPDEEFERALIEINKIALFRLEAM